MLSGVVLRFRAALLVAAIAWLSPGVGLAGLQVEIIAAPNFVVDSNVESPSSYGPRCAYLEARFCNNGTNVLTNVVAYIGNYVDGTNDTPGLYPTNRHVAYPTIVGTLSNGTFALTHEGGSAGLPDATRYIGTLAPGQCVVQYWLVGYPTKDKDGKAVWGPSIKPDDDLQLQYDIWVTGLESGVKRATVATQTATLRNEISAMANKIFPNTANKVPGEYQAMLQQYSPAWTNVASDGTPGTPITTEGIWYDLGNVGEGFDADLDLVPDRDLWMQPVGDPELFDSGAFRLFRTYVLIIVKLKTGGEQIITAQDQLYFKNIPENNGAVGYVRYEFLTMRSDVSSTLTPYQEVASGADNEKFNGDYGATLGRFAPGGISAVTLNKDVNLAAAAPGDRLDYTISYTNAGTQPLGNPAVGLPLVVQDRIPPWTRYVAGSAFASNTLPTGVTNYSIFYSTNSGVGWLTSEPAAATNVTDIQWWLSDVLPTGTWGQVKFAVRIVAPYPGPPLVVNTGALSFGSSAPFMTDDATTLVTGTNRLGDTVYLDNGVGGYFGNGTQNAGEAGMSNITVKVYYDGNSNATVDASDLYIGSAVTDYPSPHKPN